MPLITEPHLDAPDDFYEALIESHRDLTVEQSHALNARLVLLLANQIGRFDILQQALHAARRATASSL
jgi:hypothetical protein